MQLQNAPRDLLFHRRNSSSSCGTSCKNSLISELRSSLIEIVVADVLLGAPGDPSGAPGAPPAVVSGYSLLSSESSSSSSSEELSVGVAPSLASAG